MLHTLYFRLALATGVLFVLLGGALIAISTHTSEMHALETTQRVNRDIAIHAAEDMPLLGSDGVNAVALKELAHHVMFINPIVEVYLLDTEGKVLSHALPSGTVLRDRVAMEPLQRFIAGDSSLPIFGDDPRSEDGQKAFSVSAIPGATGEPAAYLYTVLNGKTYDGIQASLSENYNLRTGAMTIAVSLCFAVIGGLVLFFFLTRRLRRLARAVERYREGSYRDSIDLSFDDGGKDEISILGGAIADLSHRIERQFDAQGEIDRNRRELIANVSHDLRTPVSSVQGFLETVLVKELDTATQRDYISTAHKHCVRLNQLISELFELSTLESGSIEPNWETFTVMELIQDIVHDHELSAQERGITLLAEAEDHSIQVHADIGMIHRALDNLVQNALKHTRPGGEITLRVAEDEQRVRVEVIDDGDGIMSTDIPHIFERFYRPDNQTPAEGHGLGLAIVKRIVELHQSRIIVRSERDQGAQFSFWLEAAS
jgi:two-component system OmpR family sensor kinase